MAGHPSADDGTYMGGNALLHRSTGLPLFNRPFRRAIQEHFCRCGTLPDSSPLHNTADIYNCLPWSRDLKNHRDNDGLHVQKRDQPDKDLVELIPEWFPDWLKDYLKDFLLDSGSVRDFVQKTAQWVGGYLTNISKKLIHGASSILIEMLLVMMVSFFFIRDGAGIVEYIKSVTPLSEDERTMFFSRTKKLLNSVIFGILLTVAIQAVLGGIGWWFVGLGSPAFFGMLMFFRYVSCRDLSGLDTRRDIPDPFRRR